MAPQLRNNLKFLLIDDSKATNFFNKVMIEKVATPKDLKIAVNGLDALNILNLPYIPDLIFLDINMPVMDGWEFLKEFQKLDARFKNVSIMIMLGVELPLEKKALIHTISNVKGCTGKMLTRDIIQNVIARLNDSTLTGLDNATSGC